MPLYHIGFADISFNYLEGSKYERNRQSYPRGAKGGGAL